MSIEKQADPISEIANIAQAAALAAGKVAREAFLEADQDALATRQKAGYFDIVTAADKAAEAAACKTIWSRWPASRILGEESGWQGEGDTVWIIDPIDGTSNFASGLPFFCVSIAAYHRGQPVCGIVFDPMRDELFMAHENRLTLNGETVTPVARGLHDRDVEVLTNAPYEGGRPGLAALEAYASLVDSFRAVRRLGSCALHLAYVAVGRVAVCYESKFNAWDIAAGLQLIEAGAGEIAAYDNEGLAVEVGHDTLATIKRVIVSQNGFDLQASILSGLAPKGAL